MAKRIIRTGTTADPTGDSLKNAFTKVNDNFTELYNALGLDADGLNLGAFEFTGSVMTTTDSSAITIDQAVTVTSNLTVGGDILPETANGGDLGSLAKPFRSLFVSNNTVYLGGVPLSLEPGTNELRVNNVPISQNISYTDIPNAPVDVSDLTDTTNLLGGGGGNANTGDIIFNDSNIESETSGNFVNLDVDGEEWMRLGTSGNDKVQIITDYDGENTKTWEFNNNGNLNMPEGGAIWLSYGYIDQDLDEDSNALRISGGTGVTIKADEDGTTWRFNNNGSITFPDGSTQTTAYEPFAFNVAADDSTQKLISNNELIKFIGAGTVTTSSDAEGNITITGTGGDASLTDDKEVKVTVGNTEYWAIINRANNNDNGAEASAVAYDSDDNMVILTISDGSDDSSSDRLIISKFDSSANLLWQKQINQNIDTDVAHDLAIDSDGNIIVAASMDNEDGEVQSIVLMKFADDGSLVWQKDYQSTVLTEIILSANAEIYPGEGTFGGSAAQTLIMGGTYNPLAAGWLYQSSPDDSVWTTIGTVLGSTYNGDLNQTTVYFATGTFGGNLDDTLYYRLIGNGRDSWKEVGGIVLSGTDIFLGGQYNDANSGEDYKGLIMKVSAVDGTLAWSKTFDYTVDTRVWGMDVGADGHPVVVGLTDNVNGPGGAFVAKFVGLTGAHTWTKILFSYDDDSRQYSGADLVIDSQNNIFVSINSREQIVHNDGDDTNVTVANILKLSSTGVISWMRRIGPGPCASVATGIDCDDSGNIYVSALTVSQQNPIRETNEFYGNANTRNVLAVAKYSTDGVVLWQRYIQADSYQFFASTIEDGGDPGDFAYHGQNRGRYLSLNNSGKLAVQVTAKHIDLDDYIDNEMYYESLTFQIDQDGREMTIGSGREKFTVKESRIPGKFVTAPVYEPQGAVSATVSDLTNDVAVSNPALSVTDAILAQHIFKSAPYEYVFGNDGTLTIPNDGDIRLVQTQIGWFSVFGPVDNTNADIEIRCNVVDSDTGYVYVAGQEHDLNRGFVARYNSQGQMLWSIRLYDNDEGYNNRCNAIKINPVTGNIVVLCEYYGNYYTNTLLVEIDPDTAKVVSSAGFRDQNENGVAIAYDFDFFSNGDVAVVGKKADEYNNISVTPQTGSGVGILVILNSATASNAVHPVTDSWVVSGTGITGRVQIDYVNRYTGVTGTVRQGTGATFNVVANDGDPGIYTVTVNAGGTNYRVGHKIKILGTSLGGATPANDLIITVATADSITGQITSITYTDNTAGGSDRTEYNGVSGTNYETGSGLTFTFDGDDNSTYTEHNYVISAAGTNYGMADIVVVPGTQLGGTSPANDLTISVSVVDGAVTGFNSFSGTQQTTTRRITITDSIDFGGTGSWTVGRTLGDEAFVVRYGDGVEWSKVLSAGGAGDSERYLSVAVDSSNNVYAAGEMTARNNAAGEALDEYTCAVVSKFNSSGAHQWSKALNTSLNNSYAKGVAVRGSTLAVSHNTDTNDAIVTKLDTSGNVKWQRITYTSGGDSSVAVDTNGDIYAAIESNLENRYEDVIKIVRFAPSGDVVYRKFVGTLIQQYDGSDERFKNGRNLTIDTDHMYISGYTTAFENNANNGFIVKLPKAGDCDGSYGVWTMQTDGYDLDKISETEAATFTPVINTGNWETWAPNFVSNWWDPSGNNYYHTLQEIRDRDGGAIEFADGTRQTSSAQQIPQRKISNGADHRLTLEDMGKHIYVTDNSMTVNIPYHYDNPLPMGFTVVIVNNCEGTVSIDADGGNISVVVPGSGSGQYWDLEDQGMATLLKVDEYTWFLTGNVTNDD
jgi:hypothetical protein